MVPEQLSESSVSGMLAMPGRGRINKEGVWVNKIRHFLLYLTEKLEFSHLQLSYTTSLEVSLASCYVVCLLNNITNY